MMTRRVGIDLALRAPHRATIYEGADPIGKPIKVPRTKEGIDLLVRRATTGFDGACEFIMEPTGLAWLPLAAELDRRGFKTFVPKAQKTSALRKFLAQFAKTDTIDSRAQALIRHVDPKGVHPLAVPTAAETTLRMTVKQRARLVVDAARAKGRIQGWLVLVNPDLCAAFDGDPFSAAGTALLRRYVDPFAVRALGKRRLGTFLKQHAHGDSVDEARVEAIWQACETACSMFAELRDAKRLPFDYEVMQTMVRLELERIEHLENQIAALDEVLAAVYTVVDPDRVLEREVPGIGPTIAPTIEGLVGNVERFANVKQFAAFFGLVPRTLQTGGSEGTPRLRLTKGGQRLLKQYMFLAAESARRADPELARTYATCITRGKHHYASVIAVAHKLVRKVYALLKQRAAARRALAEGRTPAAVAWRYVTPDGEVLTKKEARAWVAKNYPSRSKQLAAKKAATAPQTRSVPQGTGSSEDATNGDRGEPPTTSVAVNARGGNPAQNSVENQPSGQAQKELAQA